MERAKVYELIDGERDYQDKLGEVRDWTPEERNPAQSVGDFITLLATYVRRAQEAYADKPGNIPALDVVRKIAGIAVLCMENHETPPRIIPTEPPKKRKWRMPTIFSQVSPG